VVVTLVATNAAPNDAENAPASRKPVLDALSELLADGRHKEILAIVAKLVARNGELERRLADILGRGRKSEGVSSAQLSLFLKAVAQGLGNDTLDQANRDLRDTAHLDDKDQPKPKEDEPKAPPPRQPSVRRPAPPNLRRIENLILVPASERACPGCGKERGCIGHDVSEVIELIPAEVVVRVDRREKLACKPCEGELVRAPTGDKIVEGGKLGTRLVGTILYDKYWDGLPLNRTRQRLEGLGLSLPISTLADQMTWATDLLRPLWRVAMDRVLAATIMHLDATSLPVLDRDSERGIRLGSLWGYVGDKHTALYLYASTGKKNGQKPDEIGPEDFLLRRNGLVVADAATVFDKSFERADLFECGCNMHARRYFKKALDRGDGRAALPIGAFKRLYEIEAKIRDMGDDEKRKERQEHSKPIYDSLLKWVDTYGLQEPPSSALGAALRYMNNHRAALTRFLDDGRIPPDNGIVERLHVRAALTRKAYLFAGSDAGGDRAAIAYTILGCCQLAGVNAVEYLADILPRLARGGIAKLGYVDMMPDRWTKAAAGQSAVEGTTAAEEAVAS
jgi:transposase